MMAHSPDPPKPRDRIEIHAVVERLPAKRTAVARDQWENTLSRGKGICSSFFDDPRDLAMGNDAV